MTLTYGELFAGYSGLGMGVQSVLGGEMSWCAEFDAAPSKILAHHWPDVPNLGDVTKVDWASVPKVDVITAGTPCQDLSNAGKRAGMTTGTRSNLWGEMREAIAVIRPRLVVWENVRGAYSACADSEMGRCPRCVGDDPTGAHAPYLRALGRVLGDLSSLGYDARWYGLRAADVGAPHGRFRIFVFAADANRLRGERPGITWGRRAGLADDRLTPADAGTSGLQGARRPSEAAWTDGQQGATTDGDHHTPADTEGHEQREPADTARWRAGLRTEPWDGADSSPDASSERHGRGQDGRALGRVDGCDAGETRQRERPREVTGDRGATDWGEYAPAVTRWAAILGRPAPAPTEAGPKGGQQLSPRFVEWMQGLPEGHVTDPAIGISRNDQLKALGNGVVPQQAAAATAMWLRDIESERVA